MFCANVLAIQSESREFPPYHQVPLACINKLIAEPKTMARFLSLFLQKLCTHRFSWPHSVHGRDYQVCVICGTAYEYDWATMRRVRKLTMPRAGQAEYKSAAS